MSSEAVATFDDNMGFILTAWLSCQLHTELTPSLYLLALVFSLSLVFSVLFCDPTTHGHPGWITGVLLIPYHLDSACFPNASLLCSHHLCLGLTCTCLDPRPQALLLNSVSTQPSIFHLNPRLTSLCLFEPSGVPDAYGIESLLSPLGLAEPLRPPLPSPLLAMTVSNAELVFLPCTVLWAVSPLWAVCSSCPLCPKCPFRPRHPPTSHPLPGSSSFFETQFRQEPRPLSQERQVTLPSVPMSPGTN